MSIAGISQSKISFELLHKILNIIISDALHYIIENDIMQM